MEYWFVSYAAVWEVSFGPGADYRWGKGGQTGFHIKLLCMGLSSNSKAKSGGGNIFLLYFNSIVMVPHTLEFIAIVVCLC